MKNIYLPNFVIALIRTPRLPPNFAQFAVPLNLNKLDLRNYLQNAYKINPLSIRSSIRHAAVELVMEGKTRRYKRKRAEKRMTIEMKDPFVWPEEPKDLSKFDHELYMNIEKYRDSLREVAQDGRRGRLEPTKTRERLKAAMEEQQKAEAAGGFSAPKEEVTDIDFDAVTEEGNTKS
ncbi:hypothetical protein ABW19_dt0201433 [Dactylella cylindrospora]|nr:hypothetical protein ABW19_dt0201433 [Dactylella cylindrospora]